MYVVSARMQGKRERPLFLFQLSDLLIKGHWEKGRIDMIQEAWSTYIYNVWDKIEITMDRQHGNHRWVIIKIDQITD